MLSLMEAEYVALLEVMAEILFICNILEFLQVEVKYPIVVRVDNAGAIYIANNEGLGKRTKHIDMKFHFVREHMEDGILKILYVCSKENDADVFTKNLGGKQQEMHMGKFMCEM